MSISKEGLVSIIIALVALFTSGVVARWPDYHQIGVVIAAVSAFALLLLLANEWRKSSRPPSNAGIAWLLSIGTLADIAGAVYFWPSAPVPTVSAAAANPPLQQSVQLPAGCWSADPNVAKWVAEHGSLVEVGKNSRIGAIEIDGGRADGFGKVILNEGQIDTLRMNKFEATAPGSARCPGYVDIKSLVIDSSKP